MWIRAAASAAISETRRACPAAREKGRERAKERKAMANPLVAIVGRPNVGKSTLFNKIAGRKISITENRPGVTRDRLYADAVWRGKKFTVVDTGGIELKSADVLWKEILRQADAAIDMAQVILWMVDGKEELTAADRDVAEKLRRCKKPVVMVGAMLPSTGLGADGPRNLYNAVLTAADKDTAQQGVVVAMNNIVIGARDVIKSNTVQPDTFIAGNFGKVGTIFNNQVTYESKPLRPHTAKTPFDVSKLDALPKVGIVYNHAGVEGIQAQALVDAGYAGIVNAGVGNGNIHKSIFPILEKAAKSGIAVVRSSRVPTGATTKDAEVDDNKYGFVSSGTLNPQKSRVLLQLGLTKTKDYKKLQEYFDKY